MKIQIQASPISLWEYNKQQLFKIGKVTRTSLSPVIKISENWQKMCSSPFSYFLICVEAQGCRELIEGEIGSDRKRTLQRFPFLSGIIRKQRIFPSIFQTFLLFTFPFSGYFIFNLCRKKKNFFFFLHTRRNKRGA